ncbi:hypothetical protein [Streptomyces sp. NBC_01506]|uniref:hypothetical protein n=1 Tax=Streptomyces sp. NBC_01506 TaxID=2903887 RepID=UPI00386EE05A
MKPLLWFVLVIALAANVFAGVSLESSDRVLVNVLSGVVVLASGTALFALRRRT